MADKLKDLCMMHTGQTCDGSCIHCA